MSKHCAEGRLEYHQSCEQTQITNTRTTTKDDDILTEKGDSRRRTLKWKKMKSMHPANDDDDDHHYHLCDDLYLYVVNVLMVIVSLAQFRGTITHSLTHSLVGKKCLSERLLQCKGVLGRSCRCRRHRAVIAILPGILTG